MGKTLSKEALFVKELKVSLRERGIRVKKKNLFKFFCFIEECCPWLILHGPGIHPLTWNKVGRELNGLLKSGQEIPDDYFSYYGLIRDILKEADTDKQVSHLLSLAEDAIFDHKKQFEEEGPPPKKDKPLSSFLDEELPPKKGKPPSSLLDESIKPTHPLREPLVPSEQPTQPSPRIYPVLYKDPDSEGTLNPTYQAELEEEAAHYQGNDRPESKPPPYNPAKLHPPFPHPTPLAFPTLPGSENLKEATTQLSKQVTDLKHFLSLQKEVHTLTNQ